MDDKIETDDKRESLTHPSPQLAQIYAFKGGDCPSKKFLLLYKLRGMLYQSVSVKHRLVLLRKKKSQVDKN